MASPETFHAQSQELARAFLEQLWPELPGYLSIFELPSKKAHWFNDLNAAAALAAERAWVQNVYFGVGLQRESSRGGRGGEEYASQQVHC